ncbi:hypothetical protein [Coprobacter sp.]
MKVKKLVLILVTIITTATSGIAQPPNPYAIFGKTYVLGETTNTVQKPFVIENFASGSPVARIEHYPVTGTVKLFDKESRQIAVKQLSSEERAFTTLDPMAEKYYAISPYAYCMNNPVRYVDPNGMEFTEAAWEWVNNLINVINSRQEKNNNSIAAKQARIESGNLSTRQINKLNRQINNLSNANSQMETVVGEIGVLAASDQVYDVRSDNSMSTGDMMVGGFTFNRSNGVAEIKMPDGGDMGLFSHELKHAYQFETGQLSSDRKNTPVLCDKHDEVAAYSRGAMFGQTKYGLNNLPSIYNHLPVGPIDATNHPNIMHLLNLPSQLQKIANNTNSAFRIGGVTYYKPTK